MKMFFGLILLTIIFNGVVTVSVAPYQVNIWLKPGQGSIGAQHLCNAAIVHERVILTTASCMQFRMPGSVISHPVIPSMISVAAGHLTFSSPKVIRSVVEIKYALGFNPVTLENDLALLKLNASLLSADRSDIKWIILDDHDHINHSCIANFNNSSSYTHTNGPNQPAFIMGNKFCNSSVNATRQRDICSSYILNPGIICNITEDSLKTISDRGTPLVCDSKLFGLLSMVIPPDNKYNVSCSQQRKLNAYYSRVAPHLGWIYQEIAAESAKDSNKDNHIMAPPFVGPAPGSTQTNMTKTKKNGAFTTGVSRSLELFALIAVFYVNICYFV